MDADFEETQRDYLSGREQRWSMNSQRLEEIVAELMKPISDVRRTFDTDLSALLEEYLTEAGLHALDSAEDDSALSELTGSGLAVPNFAELALLLQQSASIYGRKVDFLYQHVLTVSDSLHNSTLDESQAEGEGGGGAAGAEETPGGSRRRRRSLHGEFTSIELEGSGGARREAQPPRPPPTLPRLYLELEPRVLTERDVPLVDYSGEPIGLLADFYVTRRLQDGELVEELRTGSEAGAALRPVPLCELQAAIEAVAPPPSPPPLDAVPIRVVSPPPPTPPPPPPTPPPPTPPPPTPPCKQPLKRKSDVRLEEPLPGSVHMKLSEAGVRKLRRLQEFSPPAEWVRGVVQRRAAAILRARTALRLDDTHHDADFRGFEPSEMGGFPGWSVQEAAAAAARAVLARTSLPARCDPDSDDDGFFEQSSLGESDTSRAGDTPPHKEAVQEAGGGAGGAEWTAWQARVVQRAHDSEGRGADVQQLADTVLRALHDAHGEASFTRVLRAAATDPRDVSKLFLATLFLANAGNVEVVAGAPLSLDSFSLRMRSSDPALYAAAAAAAAAAPHCDPLR